MHFFLEIGQFPVFEDANSLSFRNTGTHTFQSHVNECAKFLVYDIYE